MESVGESTVTENAYSTHSQATTTDSRDSSNDGVNISTNQGPSYSASSINSIDSEKTTIHSNHNRSRRKLRERFRGQSQYLVFQKAYCIITTFPHLSLMFKILQAIADAERHFHSISPVVMRKPFQQTTSSTSSVTLFEPVDSHMLNDNATWRLTSRMNFLKQVQRALVSRKDADNVYGKSLTSSAGYSGQANKTMKLVATPISKLPISSSPNPSVTVAIGDMNSNTLRSRTDFPILRLPGYIESFELNESALSTTQEWTMAVLLSCITPRNIFQLINLLLMEKSLVIVGKNVGMVTALAFAAVNLLSPFTWEGVFVPMVPDSARELFGAPVPFILGTTSPPRSEDLSPTAAVLFLQESISFVSDSAQFWKNSGDRAAKDGFTRRLSSVADAVTATIQAARTQSKLNNQTKGTLSSESAPVKHMSIEYTTWFTRLPDVSADMPLSEQLEREVTTAAAFFNDIAKNMWWRNVSQEVLNLDTEVSPSQPSSSQQHTLTSTSSMDNINVIQPPSKSKTPTPNLNLNICFLSYMTTKEKRVVHNCLKALFINNKRFAGDLSDHSAWRRYIKFNPITSEDEFIPHLFMEPMRSIVEFQDAVVQTQLFLGYVDRVRTEYNCLEPYRIFISDWVSYRWRLRMQQQLEKLE